MAKKKLVSAVDMVNRPPHYRKEVFTYPQVECIHIARLLPFCQGNAFKYVWRAGMKNPAAYREDIEKALWYFRDMDRSCTIAQDGKADEVMDLMLAPVFEAGVITRRQLLRGLLVKWPMGSSLIEKRLEDCLKRSPAYIDGEIELTKALRELLK